MKNATLNRYVFSQFLPIFLLATSFFALIIELVDIFVNLPRYLQLQTPLNTIAEIQLLYLPTCVSFGIPIAMIFASSFTLGNFYTNNELIAAFSSGVSLRQFVSPILYFAVFISIAGFFFNEHIVISTYKQQQELSRQSMGLPTAASNPNVILFDRGTRVVYRVGQYQRISGEGESHYLNDVTIIIRDTDGTVTRIIRGRTAKWDGELWKFDEVQIYESMTLPLSEDGGVISENFQVTEFDQWSDELIDLEPKAFRRLSENVEQLKSTEAFDWITSLQSSGLPFKTQLLDYHERYSFAATPFIVTIISCAIGSRFRKNIMLKSLLVSLLIAVSYYVLQMISGLYVNLATLSSDFTTAEINIVVAAWSGVVVFLVFGALLFRKARS